MLLGAEAVWLGIFCNSRIDLLVLGVALCSTPDCSLFTGVGTSRSRSYDLGVHEDSTTLFRSL